MVTRINTELHDSYMSFGDMNEELSDGFVIE